MPQGSIHSAAKAERRKGKKPLGHTVGALLVTGLCVSDCMSLCQPLLQVRMLQRRPAVAALIGAVVCSPPRAASSGSQYSSTATISTSLGIMRFRIEPPATNAAPRAAATFTELANRGFYDDSAISAVHPECVVGGDPRSRLGYGPDDGLIRGGFFYGKVRAWGSDESRLFGGAKAACPAGTGCGVATRSFAEKSDRTTNPAFGALALAIGGKPGMTVPSEPGTTGSIFEVYLGSGEPFYGERPPTFGQLYAADADVLRAIATVPVANDYLLESQGRSMPSSLRFARQRDIPRRKIAVLRVRVD